VFGVNVGVDMGVLGDVEFEVGVEEDDETGASK
jgi:hypothetical protein